MTSCSFSVLSRRSASDIAHLPFHCRLRHALSWPGPRSPYHSLHLLSQTGFTASSLEDLRPDADKEDGHEEHPAQVTSNKSANNIGGSLIDSRISSYISKPPRSFSWTIALSEAREWALSLRNSSSPILSARLELFRPRIKSQDVWNSTSLCGLLAASRVNAVSFGPSPRAASSTLGMISASRIGKHKAS